MIADKIYTFNEKELFDINSGKVLEYTTKDETVLFMNEDRYAEDYSNVYTEHESGIAKCKDEFDVLSRLIRMIKDGYCISYRDGWLPNTIIISLSKGKGHSVEWCEGIERLNDSEYMIHKLDKMESKFAPPEIIAVDFDGTLCENKWPEIGKPNNEVLHYLKRRQVEGAKLILWTCREGKQLEKAVDWCRLQNLKFDVVNRNLPESIEHFGEDSRKIYATEYIDDKNCTKFKLPFKAD